jgi:hypothetical protein
LDADHPGNLESLARCFTLVGRKFGLDKRFILQGHDVSPSTLRLTSDMEVDQVNQPPGERYKSED